MNTATESNPPVASIVVPPRLGEVWAEQGGIFVGTIYGEGLGPDYHLIVGPELETTADWNAAMEWATDLRVTGFADYTLPNRREQRFLFCNAKALFQSEWYWSSEQHVSDSYYAWMQSFYGGSQDDYHKVSKYRARAVRRLAI